MDEAERCDYIAMVRDGSILTSGTPKDLKAQYGVNNFDEVFIKSREGLVMRTLALIKRICQEMLRDKRTLALLFIAPLLILTLMYFIFNGNTVDPKLACSEC